MDAAAEDLINGDNRIADITLRYEFESQQTFTRTFSRHFGMPPGTFRKAMRNRQSWNRDLVIRSVGRSDDTLLSAL